MELPRLECQLYENILHDPPDIDKGYLAEVLHMHKTQHISDLEIHNVTESNTALIIKFKIQIKDEFDNDIIKQFFIKTKKYDPS